MIRPEEALAVLREGNRAFLSDNLLQPPLDRTVRLRLAAGQSPFAAYVSCSDSRVPPELLFGRGLGELFIVRNAGNTLDTSALGSLEFAVSVLGVPLIVVMGHEACGAVQAAVAVVRENARFPGNIGKMIQPIIPAVLEAGQTANAASKQPCGRTCGTWCANCAKTRRLSFSIRKSGESCWSSAPTTNSQAGRSIFSMFLLGEISRLARSKF